MFVNLSYDISASPARNFKACHWYTYISINMQTFAAVTQRVLITKHRDSAMEKMWSRFQKPSVLPNGQPLIFILHSSHQVKTETDQRWSHYTSERGAPSERGGRGVKISIKWSHRCLIKNMISMAALSGERPQMWPSQTFDANRERSLSLMLLLLDLLKATRPSSPDLARR